MAELPATATLRVVWFTPGNAAAAAPPRLELTAVLVGADPPERRRFSLGADLKSINLAPGRWRLAGSAAGVWIEEKEVDVEGAGTRDVLLRGWPAGTITARLNLGPQGKTAPELRVAFRADPGSGAQGGTSVPEQGQALCSAGFSPLVCRLPKGVFDLRILAAGYAPVYRWSVGVALGEKTDLGALELAHGGSVTGFLLDQEGQARRDARIALLAPSGQAIVQRAEARKGPGALDAMEVRTNSRGFFQFTRLAAGGYRLVAKTTDGASASATAEVQESSETRLAHAMVLAEPVSVDVVIEPPHHPAGASWTAVFQNLEASPSDASLLRQVPEDGALHLDLAEGVYLLVIQGDGQRWYGEEVEVRAPTARLDVRLPAVRVRGRVRLGRSPLAAASLQFGRRQSTTSVELRSNEDGVFEGFLPKAGVWPVYIEAPRPPVRRSLKGVELQESGDGIYTADIDLPYTQLAGQVVDESFQPATEAITKVRPVGSDDISFQTMVDEYGRFEAWGLPDGPALLSASAPGPRMADPLLVTPSRGDSPVTRVQVVVRPTRTLKAQILMEGSDSPLAGAFVKVTPLSPTPSLGSPILTTDVEGRFEALLPSGTQAVDVTFGTLRYSYQMLRIDPLKAAETTLRLEPTGGRLVLEFAQAEDQGQALALFHQGAIELVSALGAIDAEHGQGHADDPHVRRVTLTPLASGQYSACFLPTAFVTKSQGQPSPAQCASGTLSPGGELYLRVP